MFFIYSFFCICVGLPASGNLVVFCFSGRCCLWKHAFGILRRDICPCGQGDFGECQALRDLWTASGSNDALLTVNGFFSVNNKKENSGGVRKCADYRHCSCISMLFEKSISNKYDYRSTF